MCAVGGGFWLRTSPSWTRRGGLGGGVFARQGARRCGWSWVVDPQRSPHLAPLGTNAERSARGGAKGDRARWT